jgi:hypothetical protein
MRDFFKKIFGIRTEREKFMPRFVANEPKLLITKVVRETRTMAKEQLLFIATGVATIKV